MRHPIRLLVWGALGLLLFVATVSALSPPSTTTPGAGPAAPIAATASYNHAQLQTDAAMTQGMSTPNASGPMQSGKIQEPMLQRSQNPAYVKALEQHQAEIDRMLARGQ